MIRKCQSKIDETIEKLTKHYNNDIIIIEEIQKNMSKVFKK